RDNRAVLYQRVPRLFDDLALARGDGRHSRLLRGLGRVDLLILDDWGLEPLNAGARHDLLSSLSPNGTRSLAIPLIPTACSIVSSTTLTASICPARACAEPDRRKAERPETRDAVDMPLRLDNANRVAHMPTATAAENSSRKQQVWPQS